MNNVQQNRRKNRRRRTKPQSDWLFRGLLIAFFIAAGITAVLVFSLVKDTVTAASLLSGGSSPDIATTTPDPNANPNDPTITPNPNVQAQPAADVQLAEWDGSSRVNILIMGLDYHDWRAGEGPPRTDTMIVFTIDPQTKTAGMLSIPRDLWVQIPGFEHARINTAYMTGEGNRLPGGGPGLAVKTVEQFLGITIHYYAQVDFVAFVDFVDEIGGVKIDVPERIKVDLISKDGATWIDPGVQTLYGEHALAYARARYTEGGDFDRAQRQQQVIFGIRNQLLRPDIFLHITTNGPTIFANLSSGIQTNMTYDEILQLGLLAKQIDVNNIKHGVIAPPDMVTLDTSPDGTQQVLKPITENIRILRDDIFTTQAATSAVILGVDTPELIAEENASVAVYNGTATSGLAGTTEEYLKSQGINVTLVGNADLVPYTKIIDYTGNPYTVQFLVDTMGIQKNKIFSRYDPNSAVDIEVVVGDDWSVPQ
jgi:LCP family protein required for cell wall assembly